MNNHDSPPRPVIALDFDGTICQNAYPDIGEPNWHVIEKAKRCQEQGAYLILWTCRGGQMLEKAVAACTEWGLTFDAINENLPEWREAYGTDPGRSVQPNTGTTAQSSQTEPASSAVLGAQLIMQNGRLANARSNPDHRSPRSHRSLWIPSLLESWRS